MLKWKNQEIRREKMLELLQETLIDSIKLLPFLWITYLIMEYIEHKMQKKTHDAIQKAGKWGPAAGAVVGLLPQCGFSVAATNLYAARIITLGTLMAVYLATSDEMLPIFIAESVPLGIILKILAVKLVIAMLAGFAIDVVWRKTHPKQEETIKDLCEDEHCDCEHGILKSSLKHTVHIFVFILVISFVLHAIMHFIGEENVKMLAQTQPVLAPVICCLVGLIPNCASSVILTQLYLENVITVASMLGGLLVNAGVGLVVLFRVNKGIKENVKIVGLLLAIGIMSSYVLQVLQVENWIG